MVQSADPAAGSDDYRSCRTLLYGGRHGSVLVDSEMSPVFMVVGPVLAEQTPKLLVVASDDVVEQLPPHRTHQALGALFSQGLW